MTSGMTYTVQQLAERWQCDQRVVLAAIHSHKLRAFPLVPGSKRPTWRIPEESVLAFERGERPDPTPKPTRRRKADAGIIQFF